MIKIATPSPAFHEGEQALQLREGSREQCEIAGPYAIRDYLDEGYRDFFACLPSLFVGALDATGQPWASVLAGPLGFVSTPRDNLLRVARLPMPQDPIDACLQPGMPLALLGLRPEARRRNRVNGVVDARGDDAFTLAVRQCFGNCPKYIQARTPQPYVRSPGVALVEGPLLSPRAQALIAAADTLFIASASADPLAGPPQGVDMSHRGGPPGFVTQNHDGAASVLGWRDYIGNGFFNTLGNLSQRPACGLLFIDFVSGDLLQLAASAELLWDAQVPSGRTPLTERRLRLTVSGGVLRPAALQLAWSPAQPAPQLAFLPPGGGNHQ